MENRTDRARRRRGRGLLGALVGLGLGLAAFSFVARSGPGPSPDRRSAEARERTDLEPGERRTIDLFRRASPSVVHITTRARVRESWFSTNVVEIPQGTGSGFVWDDEGHVVTNFHVIQEAVDVRGTRFAPRRGQRAVVTLQDHSTWEAEVVGVSPDKDVAVLDIDAPREQLRPIQLGESYDLVVGQKVLAIGNPFGLDQTLTTGVISGLGREIYSVSGRKISDVIQTDAAINPGNSGGPLLDSAGRLIGVNTAIVSPSGAYAGIGFAVPADVVVRIVPELIRHGRPIRPGLGVRIGTNNLARSLGVQGAIVTDVIDDTAASRAGLRAAVRDGRGRIHLGDVIVGFENEPIRRSEDLLDVLNRHAVGDEVTVVLVRDGEQRSLPIRLQAID